MLLTEYFLNGVRTKEKTKALTEEQQLRLFEFDRSAGFKDNFEAWKKSLTCLTDLKAKERYRQVVEAGTKLSFEEYCEKVLNEDKK